VGTVYNQWTQFEEFPLFMEGVERVEQLDDRRLHWVARFGGKRKEWDAEIVEQVPDQRVAWRSISGTPNEGQVRFTPTDRNGTVITLRLNFEPETTMERIAGSLGMVGSRVESDLRHFKDFIQHRQTETGAWRGEIRGGQTSGPGDSGAQ